VRFAAVVAAAGRSLRFGSVKKEYELLDGVPVVLHSVRLFLENNDCAAIALVIPPDGEPEARAALGEALVTRWGPRLLFVEGGQDRGDSVKAGLLALRSVDPELVLVHDAARPYASKELLRRVLDGASRFGACVPGFPVSDTIKRISDDGVVSEHLVRASLRAVQTPQGFQYRGLLSAYLSAGASAGSATDDSDVWAKAGGAVVVIDGERSNRKITYPEDLP